MAADGELTMDDLTLSDPGEDVTIDEDISFLDSPAPSNRHTKRAQTPPRPVSKGKASASYTPPPDIPPDPAEREARLKQELATLKTLNGHLSTMIGSLETAQKSLGTVNRTVEQSSTLLNTWTRILSQTEHNQRLILDPNWQGASSDAAEMAAEEERREAEKQRRRGVEERRKAEREQKLEEERMKREASIASTSTSTSTTRGSTRARKTTTPARGGVTGVRGVRGGVRGGSATSSGRGIQRSTSVGARGRGTTTTRGGRARGS